MLMLMGSYKGVIQHLAWDDTLQHLRLDTHTITQQLGQHALGICFASVLGIFSHTC